MESGATAKKYMICVSCGPNANKCVRQNTLCKNPRAFMSEEAYDKISRVWMLSKRHTKVEEKMFLYNYYDYYTHFYDDDIY